MSNDHEWLNLIEVSGPFLAVPVLRDIFPQGLEALTGGRPEPLRVCRRLVGLNQAAWS